MIKKLLIVILVVNCYALKAQPISVGLSVEPFYLMSNIGSTTESKLYSTSFYFNAGFQISSHVKVEVCPGIIISEGKRYNAYPEIGLFCNYFLREGKEYVLLGFVVHSNKGESSNSIHLEVNKIYLGCVGVGTYVNRNLILEILYQFPIGEKQYSLQDQIDIYNNHISTPMSLIGLIKLGFGFSFDL